MGIEQRRPEIPADCPAGFAALICFCWAQSPSHRPSFQTTHLEAGYEREDFIVWYVMYEV